MFATSIDKETLNKVRSLGLPEKRENNQYLLLRMDGDGVRAPKSWNVKIYTNGKNELKLVTTDEGILKKLLNGESSIMQNIVLSRDEPLVTPPIPKFTTGKTLTDFVFEGAESKDPLLTLQVDDAGWGFPLGGVMIGATDGNRVETGLIDQMYFQDGAFESKGYLQEAANITLELIAKFGAMPDNSRIEICPGYINSTSRKTLIRKGYRVEVKQITGLLQNELEKKFFEYISTLGYESYYDPKETTNISKKFNDVIKWIYEDGDNRMALAKTGWKYFKK
jgi:hypothetical protein